MKQRLEIPHPLALGELLSRLGGEGLLLSAPSAEVELRGIEDDSRRVRAGDLFCAWQGTATDGHAFLPAAQAAGAVAALVERPVAESTIPQVVVRDGRRAAAVAASRLYGEPGASLVLAGVTGTNGKTTTVWLLRHLLGLRHQAASLGTLGVVAADGAWVPADDTLTTPGPVALAALLRALVDAGVGAVAMEVSSHALEQARVAALRFDAAVFTNLTRDHLDYHGTLEAYLAAKRSLVDLLRPGGAVVTNQEDPAWKGLLELAPRGVSFGLCAEAGVRAEDVEFGSFGARFHLVAPGGAARVHMPLLGAFNVQNALAAAGAALMLGMGVDEVAERLSSTPQVPGRLEKISDAPCPVLRDYAHTPDALERVLAALRPLVKGRLIVLFGAGGDRDRGKRPLMGAVVERWADLAIVTSDNPRTEEPESILDEIVAGMSGERYLRVVNRREAISRALEEARADDLVLLAGKGHETYQILGREKHPFDEAAIVAELLGGSVREVSA